MLANIENIEMKAESPEFAQQGIEIGLCQALAAIRHQAFSQQNQVGFKFRGVQVRILCARAFAAPLQSVKEIRKKSAVMLNRVARAPGHGDIRHGARILCDPRNDLRRRLGLPRRRTQAIAQEFYLLHVFAEDHAAR